MIVVDIQYELRKVDRKEESQNQQHWTCLLGTILLYGCNLSSSS